MCFLRDFHDWELDSVNSFLDLLYSQMPRGLGDDRLRWCLNRSGIFDARSYYKVILWYKRVFIPLEEYLVR